MKFSSVFLALAASMSSANAYWKGFNMGAANADGSCKSTQDWTTAFNAMKALPGGFTSVRLYASSDCGTLANAVPAALATGVQILVGVWTEDSDHYNTEKAALLSAVQQYGSDWIIAVSVGSEDLYRGDTDAETLASQIHDVRGMMCGLGACGVQVGHTDTYTAWTNSTNTAVIQACDFVMTDEYPYYEGYDISQAADDFWAKVNLVRDTVNAVAPGIWVWIGETGWEVTGDAIGAAQPSLANLQTYWSEVACAAFDQVHIFWYDLQDYSLNPSFGVVDANFNPIIDLTC